MKSYMLMRKYGAKSQCENTVQKKKKFTITKIYDFCINVRRLGAVSKVSIYYEYDKLFECAVICVSIIVKMV